MDFHGGQGRFRREAGRTRPIAREVPLAILSSSGFSLESLEL